MKFDPQPVALEGRFVRLELLGPQHVDAIFAAAHPSIWTYLMVPPFRVREDAARFVEEAQQAQRLGTEIPYATVRRSDGKLVGSTRFIDIRRPHRGLEIGWTWINPEAQRSPVNTEAKYLMLGRAFERWGALRVQLKSDERNEKSRRAMERIGAQFEGIHRNHMFREYDGYIRNSAMYAFVDREWPAAKARLEGMMAKYA